MESMVGQKARVLIEKKDPEGTASGYGEHYLPVQFPSANGNRNSFRTVRMERIIPGDPPMMDGSEG
jgi:threonylcarbamoyladenosine tRNA methylthiotransferase MtaB